MEEDNNWIDVKEKYPPKEGAFLCVLKDTNCVEQVQQIGSIFRAFGKVDMDGKDYIKVKDITHWMEMPEPPEQC